MKRARTVIEALAVALAGLGGAAAPGCSDSEPQGIEVSVQKQAANGCWATMVGGAPDPAFPRTDSCASATPPSVVAGDLVRAVIDYNDVRFSDSTAVSKPAVTLMMDGIEVAAATSIEALPLENGRAFFVATFRIPERQARQALITVKGAPGFEWSMPQSLSVVPPNIELRVEQCPASGICTMTAGVGNANLHVSVEGETAQSLTVWFTLDGVTQPTAQAVSTTASGGKSTAIAFVPVPIAPAGTRWQIFARLDQAVWAGPSIELRAPPISATIECGTGSECKPAAGGRVSLTVLAPRLLRATTAEYRVLVDGVPHVTAGVMTLDQTDVVRDTISGTQPVDVPAKPGATMLINVSVAGYPAASIVVVIAPAATP